MHRADAPGLPPPVTHTHTYQSAVMNAHTDTIPTWFLHLWLPDDTLTWRLPAGPSFVFLHSCKTRTSQCFYNITLIYRGHRVMLHAAEWKGTQKWQMLNYVSALVSEPNRAGR